MASAPARRAASRIASTLRYDACGSAGPMAYASPASRTCRASASAPECTAATGMPIARQVRATRTAISPRLAIRILRKGTSGDPVRLALLEEGRQALLALRRDAAVRDQLD